MQTYYILILNGGLFDVIPVEAESEVNALVLAIGEAKLTNIESDDHVQVVTQEYLEESDTELWEEVKEKFK